MYFNLLLPTSVGGDVVRAWYLDGRSGRRWPAFAAVLLDRLNGLAVLVALACLGVLMAPLDLPAWIAYSVWGIAAAGMLVLIVVRILSGLQISRALKMEHLKNLVDISCQPRLLAATLPLSVCVQLANVLLVWLIGQAIGAPVPAAYYCLIVPMVSLLTLLPISVNGMGVREEATVLFLAPLGIAEGTALTLSVLWFAAGASVSLLGGVVYLLGHFPKLETSAPPLPVSASPSLEAERPTETENQEEVTCGSIGGDSDQGRAGQHRRAA
jgi:uncharacterized membrane protein YbhN (UPF0104 family)